MRVRLHPGVQHRLSKRGLVLASPTGEVVLLEHPRAREVPALLASAPSPEELVAALGPPVSPDLCRDLLDLGILRDADADPRLAGAGTAPVRRRHAATAQHRRTTAVRRPRVTFTRAGIMVPGIAVPATCLHRHVLPLVVSWPGRLMLAAVVAAGVTSLLLGRPDVPAVSASPATEALLVLLLGLTSTVLHELAHAVALVHYGRRPRRAGFGFYWGALSFFVDSTPAMTLPRRARVVQASAGLAVDVVVVSLFAIAAQLSDVELLTVVLWRLAVLGVVDLVTNALPVLQVDGHWIVADLLDEPDLSPRARAALAAVLHRRPQPGQRGLATYGALSLLVGLALLGGGAWVYWNVAGDLTLALLGGDLTDILIGVYLVGPLLLGTLFSALGLLLESVLKPPAVTAAHEPSTRRGARGAVPVP